VTTTTGYSALKSHTKLIVGVADMIVDSNPINSIVTYALGSCIGVTIYDPIAQVGGMLHFMLPDSKVNKDKAVDKPAMFGDTGIPQLFKNCYELGAKKERLIVCAAGGAEVLDDDGHFKIGKRNRTLLRKIFWKNNILVSSEETGGSISRTLTLSLENGSVSVFNKGKGRQLWPE
jgi:chemotaxis protein CheD